MKPCDFNWVGNCVLYTSRWLRWKDSLSNQCCAERPRFDPRSGLYILTIRFTLCHVGYPFSSFVLRKFTYKVMKHKWSIRIDKNENEESTKGRKDCQLEQNDFLFSSLHESSHHESSSHFHSFFLTSVSNKHKQCSKLTL